MTAVVAVLHGSGSRGTRPRFPIDESTGWRGSHEALSLPTHSRCFIVELEGSHKCLVDPGTRTGNCVRARELAVAVVAGSLCGKA